MMPGAAEAKSAPASLEALVESGELGIDILHPGGLAMTRALAELCHVGAGASVLDVAAGTGESACFLVESFGCRVTGVDHAPTMVERARQKARARGLAIEFREGDAHHLPFAGGAFDVVLSECATCALDKREAVSEMVRVARSGGYVGISDLCWREAAPARLRARLVEVEGESPEELAGWRGLFVASGLDEVQAVDRGEALAVTANEMRQQLGVGGYLKLLRSVWRRWGRKGMARVLASERIFRSRYLSYALVVGRKR